MKVRKRKGCDFMELAKVTTKGQVTIPKPIRELLDLKEGSLPLFLYIHYNIFSFPLHLYIDM